ncbi:aminoglycoside phosphotransferase family protein [Janibacter limosus]|uniref:Aminoglycoside phosphotransferase family protein n=1 Tax=Janibacter limosus TaxID=53458 RepID=A0AC61U719_9MICO|nr:aminoglycoside phosphotransferase family protein [Janibacter limosus]UUZ45778.1 aminoglycoside phosphotransferase family protein [Janibacter limosus]
MRVEDAAALVPAGFVARLSSLPAEGGPAGSDWVAALPHLLVDVLEAWELTVDGEAMTGQCALVLPVRGPEGSAALKLGWPHREADGEHLALRARDGRGAVRLLRADPRRSVLLLERLTTQDLTDQWDEEAVAIVAGLYADLHVTPLPQVPALVPWVEEIPARPAVAGLPRRFVEQASGSLRSLGSLGGERLLHGDLHYGNVLSDGTDWVAIDPKPVTGHPAREVAPLLTNRVEEMGTGASLRWSVRRRVEVVCDVAGPDDEAVRSVSALREVVNAVWATEDGDAERVSQAIALIKALGD